MMKGNILQQKINILNKKVNKRLLPGIISLKCSDISGYSYRVSGCDQTWNYKSTASLKPVIYTIDSQRSYSFNVNPSYNDSKIEIEANNYGGLVFKNKTERRKYLQENRY